MLCGRLARRVTFSLCTHARPLPLIDLSRFMHGSDAERAAVASQWDAAFCEVGFCQLRGFEPLLSAGSIRRLRSEATRYFESAPPDVKLRSHVGEARAAAFSAHLSC